METVFIEQIFNATPAELYQAWLDSKLHSEMTGGVAVCGDKVGDSFSAWDGYISGKNLELHENQRILQSWRTVEFAESDADSLLTLTFQPVSEGTQMRLTHTNIPAGQTQYQQGWVDNYITPMLAFFR